jgi:hypothetical protein
MAGEQPFGRHLAANQSCPLGGAKFGLCGLSDHTGINIDGRFISLRHIHNPASSGGNIRQQPFGGKMTSSSHLAGPDTDPFIAG